MPTFTSNFMNFFDKIIKIISKITKFDDELAITLVLSITLNFRIWILQFLFHVYKYL